MQLLQETNVRGAPPKRNTRAVYAALSLTCLTYAQMCFFTCDGKDCEYQVCSLCYDESNGIAFCDGCASIVCLSCLDGLNSNELCQNCAAAVSEDMIECGCGSEVHLSRLVACSRCHDFDRWTYRKSLLWSRKARALMQCCACRVVCCLDCDPHPDDGGTTAGVAAREAWSGPFLHPRLAEYRDCTFCCSRPEACSGLADFLKLAEELEGEKSSGDDAGDGDLECCDDDCVAVDALDSAED